MNLARIAVLVIALGAGGAAAMLASRIQPEPIAPASETASQTDEVLVAKSDLGSGNVVSSDSFEWQPWPANSGSGQFLRRSERPRAMEQLAGSVVRSPFLSGEPVRESKLLKANGSGYMAAMLPSGKRAVSAEITPENGASGFILPNDHVDVILTRVQKIGGQEVYVGETVLSNVRVLAIDQQLEEKSGQKVAVGKIALLELDPKQAETVALSRRMGTLSLTLRSLADSGRPADTASSDAHQSSMTIVRYGQVTSSLTR